MYKSYSMELAGRTLTVDIGRVCAQANGAALLKYGETTVLSTATASDKPRDGVDFFPLSVEFEEKMYSVGKIPGGFNKREGKASENSILTARVIDRPMRPLFPKDYRNDVTLNNMVMSVDPECRPELVAMIGAALSTTISDIPFDGPCAMTQMGMKNGEFIVNPSQKDWDEGDLKLTVASTATKVIMIEAGANEIPEAKMIEAIYKCHALYTNVLQERQQHYVTRYAQQVVMNQLYKLTSMETSFAMRIQAVRFRKKCLQLCGKSLLRSRWKKRYLPMKSSREKKISVKSQINLQKLLQRTRSGLQFLTRPFTNIRRRLFVR